MSDTSQTHDPLLEARRRMDEEHAAMQAVLADQAREDAMSQLLGSGDNANPEFVAKAAAVLCHFNLPFRGEDGAACAAAAAVGCMLVDMMAKMSVTHGLMPTSTGAAVEGLTARAIEAWSALAKEATDAG